MELLVPIASANVALRQALHNCLNCVHLTHDGGDVFPPLSVLAMSSKSRLSQHTGQKSEEQAYYELHDKMFVFLLTVFAFSCCAHIVSFFNPRAFLRIVHGARTHIMMLRVLNETLLCC